MYGARFDWYCLEVRHFNCFNQLENDESFICWDSRKENVWIRRPPSFAVRTHPNLKARKDTYQIFLERANTDGISIVGVRMAESVQRLQYIAAMTKAGRTITRQLKAFPIYDWTNNDVWLFLQREHVDIPIIYLYLWQAGTRKSQLRVSQFFSVDTARSLVKMNEYYPNLMDRIILREPNAYLAALYWDSDMFGRNSKDRKELEKGQEKKDYKAELSKLFANFDAVFDTPHKRFVGSQYKRFFVKVSNIATEKDFQDIYESLVAGDPKLRNQRALYMKIFGRYVKTAKEKEAGLYG
jgi:predicted phosphoadenosine phosphosulfate sulfurtransferase